MTEVGPLEALTHTTNHVKRKTQNMQANPFPWKPPHPCSICSQKNNSDYKTMT